MAAKMHLAQQRSFSDNSTSSFKFSENPRSIKIVPDLKCQDKKTVSYLDDFISILPVEVNVNNFEDSQEVPNKTMGRPVSCGRIGSFCNTKLEKRYRTNSTDSAFSEESFVDLDGDESTNLESLIDQLIFTDDRLDSDMSTYVKTEKLPSTDTSILDVGDLFNNTDIFTVDFESLAHENQASSFLDKETWPDSENTESTSSSSSSDSGKVSIHKYPTKISAFSECNPDNVLNGSSNSVGEKYTKFSSGLFISLDEDKVIDCDGSILNKPIVSAHADGTGKGDGCVNDCIHECSFVDLSTLLDANPYGSPFSVGENFPIDSQRHLNADDDVCIHESNGSKTDCSDSYESSNTTLRQVTSTKIPMSASHVVTTKSNDSSNNKSNNSKNEILLKEVHFWPMKEEDKMETPLSSVKNYTVKCMDISEENLNKIVDESINDCDGHSQESLCFCSLENLCGYGDQEMSGINQNNNGCNFLSDTYDEPENRFSFEKNTLIIDGKDGKDLLRSSEDKSSEIKFSNQRDAKEGIDLSKDFNGIKPLNINDSVVRGGDKSDTIKLESYFPDIEFSRDNGEANTTKAQSSARDVWTLSNEDHIKGVVAKDHSYKAPIPAKYKERNISIIDTKENSNRINQMTDSPVKQNPAKRQLVKDLNSVNQESLISKENSSKSVSSSAKAEYPGLKLLLQEESSSAIESVLQTSTNSNYYPFDYFDDSGCIQRKIPKISIIDNDETRVQSAILYQVLAMEQHSPSTSLSSSPFLPAKSKVKNNQYSKSPNDSNFKRHYLTNLRQGTMSKQVMSIRMKDEPSEMKELEKYLRGIIPTENYNRQDETSNDHQRKTSGLFIRQDRSPCSFLQRLLTGEMTTQMYREIDQQFCKNEQLIKNKMKMD